MDVNQGGDGGAKRGELERDRTHQVAFMSTSRVDPASKVLLKEETRMRRMFSSRSGRKGRTYLTTSSTSSAPSEFRMPRCLDSDDFERQ